MSTATPYSPPPRRSHGCLWGCLGVLILFFLPVLLAWGYATWFFWQGFRDDPAMRTASEFLRQDNLAHLVLGPDIAVTGIEGNAFSFAWGFGAHSAMVMDLQGEKGAGSLAVTSHSEGGVVKLDSAILTGPDGHHYDLLRHGALPGRPPTDSTAI